MPRWRRALVYGLGVSGRAASRLLRVEGVRVLGIDEGSPGDADLEGLAEDPGVEIRTGAELARVPEGTDAVILSPGVPPNRPLVEDARRRGIEVLGEVELAFPYVQGPILAVTGSNGKSTTTALAGAMVEASGRPVEVCGNIGRPLSEVVADPERRAAVFVVELSSFQLETIRDFRARAAAILNLSPDHLDRYDDLDEYRAAKERIFENQGADDVAVLPADDPELAGLRPPGRIRRFSSRGAVADGCWLEDDGTVREGRKGEDSVVLFAAQELVLPGPHNLENAMAASLLSRAAGVETEAIRRAVAAFSGLPHRTQNVGVRGGVTYWDDSKGTNVGATIKALEGFPDGRVRLILGGLAKGASFEALVPAVVRKARKVYLVGEAQGALSSVLGDSVVWERCGDLATAMDRIHEEAEAGDAVLLSPACASFDQYTSFRERGEHFQRLVPEHPRRGDGQEARV